MVENFGVKESLSVPLINPHNVIFEESGRGNNFAYGYKGDETGNPLLKKAMGVFLL